MTQLVDTAFSESANRLADPGIPTLRSVLEPNELGEHLYGVLPAAWGSLCDIQIQVLRHHPASRCVVDISLQTTTGKHELIGKVYAKDSLDSYLAMRRLSQSSFGVDDEFSIPQPVSFLPKLNLGLQEKVHGQLVTEIFERGDERQSIIAAERCARWLAHFHTRAPRSGSIWVVTNELLEQWARRLSKRCEQLREKANLLCEALKLAAGKVDPSEICACHGDFRHRQVILTETRTITFDWDSYCIAHPARDVATFILKLQKLALTVHGSRKALNAALDAFHITYVNASEFEVTKHLRFFKAIHCLRHANRHLQPGNMKIQKSEAFLHEGLSVLDEEV